MDFFTGLPTGEFALMAFEQGFEEMLNEEVHLMPNNELEMAFFKELSTPKNKAKKEKVSRPTYERFRYKR